MTNDVAGFDLGVLQQPLADRRITHDEARDLAQRRAHLFERLGVGRGDRVLLHAGNEPEFFIDTLALWWLGACAVPVDSRLTPFEVEQLVLAARPRLSVWSDTPATPVASVLSALRIRTIGATEAGSGRLASPVSAGEDAPALLIFTSGTTGNPKGVVHTRRSLAARWHQGTARLGVETFERTLCPVPTQFSFGVGFGLCPWLYGQTVLLLPPFRQDVLVRLGALCDEFDATCLPAVPTMWKLAVRTARPPQKRTLRRVANGTAPLPAALWPTVETWAGAELVNIYGMTEAGWIASAGSREPGVDDALVGLPLPSVSVRVVDSPSTEHPPDVARQCSIGETGHVWIRSEALMCGYFERPDLTGLVCRDGWFSTGDLASLGTDGRLRLRGRHKELINVGGTKVYPADVDAVVALAAGVDDVCTFSIEDALQGENAAVAIVLREEGPGALQAVFAHCAVHLAQHQLPRRWYVVERVPRTARGKLDRDAVAKACATLKAVELRALQAAALDGSR
jgi:acyl-CoA synthetase (AMP-forming)/AMP-acid ligase II